MEINQAECKSIVSFNISDCSCIHIAKLTMIHNFAINVIDNGNDDDDDDDDNDDDEESVLGRCKHLFG